MNMARIAAMAAGIPKETPATTVNRFCSSGSQAVMMAAHAILHEGVEVAIGSGVETITMMQDGTQNTTRLANKKAAERFPGLYFPMGVTAEIVAERYKVSREDQDEYALQSQQRYAAAVEKGWVAEEIAPMTVTRKVIKKERGALRGGVHGRPGRVQPAQHYTRGSRRAEAGLQEGGRGRHRDGG